MGDSLAAVDLELERALGEVDDAGGDAGRLDQDEVTLAAAVRHDVDREAVVVRTNERTLEVEHRHGTAGGVVASLLAVVLTGCEQGHEGQCC